MSGIVPSHYWEAEGFRSCLSLASLASLSCACKDWQHAIAKTYSSSKARQLVRALETSVPTLRTKLAGRGLATETTATWSLKQSLSQLWTVESFLQQEFEAPWGPALATAPGILEDFTQLFSVPGLPPAVVQSFVQQLQIRISHKQLLDAAYNRVAGVETWVQVQHYLEAQTSLPEIPLAVCCRDLNSLTPVLLQSLPVKDSVELLQLALNSSCHAVATCVAEELLPHVTDPAVLLHLVHTAVMRHHREAVQSAVDHPAAHQLKPAEVLQLMQVAADQATPAVLWYPDGFTPTSYMHMLIKLPAARGLSLDQLTPLLHTKCGATIAALSTLPAADLTVAADLNSMLQLAVAEGFDSAICALCSLSAAASLTSDDLVPLMVLAAATSSGRLLNAGVKALCRLLPIQAQHEMFRDLPVAAAQDSDKVVSDLCKLPAVRSMSSVAWVRMLIQLLPGQRRVSDTKLEALCQLPAARTASTEAIAAVLKAAVGSMRSVAVMVLCELPPAEHMTASQISAIAQEAKVHQRSQLYWAIIKLSQTRGEPICGAFDTFRALATLKGVNCLSIDQLVDIAGMLMQLECSKCSPAWYTCPAAQKMPASTLFQLMQRAVQLQDAVQLHALCQLPAAKVVDAECVQQLLISTVGRDNDTSRLMQQYLWLLLGATKITGEHLADVLSAIVGANNTLQHHFLDLPAAPLVAVDSVAGLLQNAVKHRNLSTVQKLCKLPQAHHLSHTAVAKVMLALVDCDDADKYVVAIADVVRLQVAHPAADVCNTRLEVGDAIQAAVRKGDTGLLHTYFQMSAAKVIKSNVLIQCMMEAVRLNSTAAIHKLTRLPSAAELHGEAVHGLLRTAVQMGSINVIYCLIGLPGAQQIPAEARRDLVKSAQQQGSTWAVSTLQLFLSNTC